jgi:hypothetical protein
MPRHLAACAAIFLIAVIQRASSAQLFDFALESRGSSAATSLHLSATSGGSLVGDYDPATNPTGTRTKPGLFGSFGSTENVPVPVELEPSAQGEHNSPLTGSFRASIDLTALTLDITGFQADLLVASPFTLPLQTAFSTAGFRTRNPDSLFPPASATLPIGEAAISSLLAAQSGPALGALTPSGPDQYFFSIPLPITLTAQATLQGTSLNPTSPETLLILNGFINISGGQPTLTGEGELDAAQTLTPNQPLDPFPFSLPTLLPPGQSANTIFNLTLNTTTFSTNAAFVLAATGTPIPEPSLAALLLPILLRRSSRSPTRTCPRPIPR